MKQNRKLKVFLCHSKDDKPKVRGIYRRLIVDGFDAWLDDERLLPGENWDLEIRKAVKGADVVVIFLSRGSITKAGYVQKEIKFALDVADEQPEGTIFIIPARLEECQVPMGLSTWQWVNLFETKGYKKLKQSLLKRADILDIHVVPVEEDRQKVNADLSKSARYLGEKARRPTIIVMDNDPHYLETISYLLEAAGYIVLQASTIKAAQQLLENVPVRLAILDVRATDDSDEKDRSGLVLAKDPRYSAIPKILITSFPTWDMVRAVFSPAENNMPNELHVKHEGAQRLLGSVQQMLSILRIDKGTIYVGNREVRLTRKAFELLKYLYKNANRVCTKEELTNNIFGGDYDDSLFSNSIRRIRNEIEDDPSQPRYLITVHGVGFRLVKQPQKSNL
jgi:DNA-binding response OmpR family regulator